MNIAAVFSVWFSKAQEPLGEPAAGWLPGDTLMYKNEMHTAAFDEDFQEAEELGVLPVCVEASRCPSRAVGGDGAGAPCRLCVM